MFRDQVAAALALPIATGKTAAYRSPYGSLRIASAARAVRVSSFESFFRRAIDALTVPACRTELRSEKHAAKTRQTHTKTVKDAQRQ
jgi:hypothetical protein